uniref:DOMON domain-containing protein n=1 Tax=Biomphalaria glabrata TaxID=6526 RepID=A0A2C9K6P8_BIOGL
MHPETLCILFLLLTYSWAYPSYQDQIPNGKNVMHPCIPNYTWPGVGHQNKNGGGARNPFGEAFAREGHQWTKALCATDTDGDGRTNGEELGDPSCVWAPGKTPSRTVNITHPGVCEPITSTKCQGQNSFVTCQADSFDDNCEIFTNTDVKYVDLRMPTISIPADDTTYMCLSFNLLKDQDYHIVADKPIINNTNVVHHMMLYGCDDANTEFFSTPSECEMSKCTAIIGGWTVGQTGECYDEGVGFRIGVTGFKTAVLEIHYNNPKLVSTYKDSSGLRVYYRPARPEVLDMFTMMTGQTMLPLPPGQSKIQKVGVCTSSCTSLLFKETVYVNSATNHMHLLGSSMRIELLRKGVVITNLTNEEDFDYNTPFTQDYEVPVKVLPGDEIVTRCVYNTESSNDYVYYGDATSDEMCYGYLTMYPKSALRSAQQNCVATSTLSACELAQGVTYNGCDWKTLIRPNNADVKKIKNDLYENCDLGETCSQECKDIIRTLTDPCFQEDNIIFVRSLEAITEDVFEIIQHLQWCPVTTTHNGPSHNAVVYDDSNTNYSGVTSVSISSKHMALLIGFGFTLKYSLF